MNPIKKVLARRRKLRDWTARIAEEINDYCKDMLQKYPSCSVIVRERFFYEDDHDTQERRIAEVFCNHPAQIDIHEWIASSPRLAYRTSLLSDGSYKALDARIVKRLKKDFRVEINWGVYVTRKDKPPHWSYPLV